MPTASGHSASQPLERRKSVVVPDANLAHTSSCSASCCGAGRITNAPNGQGDPNNYAAALYLYAADLTLEQTAGPSVGARRRRTGHRADGRGHERPHVHRDGPGRGRLRGGVQRRRHARRRRTVLDEAGGRCRNVGQTSDGLPAFLYLQPCPSSVSADVGLDTDALANGAAPPDRQRPRRGRQLGAGARPDDHGRQPAAAARARRVRGSERDGNGLRREPAPPLRGAPLAGHRAQATPHEPAGGAPPARSPSTFARHETIVGRLTAPPERRSRAPRSN